MITLDDVVAGDQLRIEDAAGNVIVGEVVHDDDRWILYAFETKIVFAKDRSNGLGPRLIRAVKITGHIPQLGFDHE